MKRITKKTAKKMRQNPTRCEWILMDKLKSWGIRFQFQFIVGPYVADFYLTDFHLLVEVDGFSHNTKSGVIRDMYRTAYLEKQGYKVYRIPNELVYKITKDVLIESAQNMFTYQPQDIDHEFYNSYLQSLS